MYIGVGIFLIVVGAILTFALNAGRSIDKLTTAVGQTGAEVVGGLEIKRNYLDAHNHGAGDFER